LVIGYRLWVLDAGLRENVKFLGRGGVELGWKSHFISTRKKIFGKFDKIQGPSIQCPVTNNVMEICANDKIKSRTNERGKEKSI
jgi:hypothetical protein